MPPGDSIEAAKAWLAFDKGALRHEHQSPAVLEACLILSAAFNRWQADMHHNIGLALVDLGWVGRLDEDGPDRPARLVLLADDLSQLPLAPLCERLLLLGFLCERTHLTVADRDGWIWYDGRLVPWRSATTHRA